MKAMHAERVSRSAQLEAFRSLMLQGAKKLLSDEFRVPKGVDETSGRKKQVA